MLLATPCSVRVILNALYVYVDVGSDSHPGLADKNVPVARGRDPSSPAHPCADSSGLRSDPETPTVFAADFGRLSRKFSEL